jgi:uncharacterized membrane protein YfcA
MEFLLYLLLGACAGVLAGLFGVGGGIIIVPVLVFSFTLQGFDPQVLTHLAVGTSLATIIFTSVNAVREHHRRGAVRWPIFVWMTVGILIGAGFGALTAEAISGPNLQKIIGVFALIIAVQLALEVKPKDPGRYGDWLGFGDFRHRRRLADRAVFDLAQRTDAAGGGHLIGLWLADCPGQCIKFHDSGLA